MGFILLALILVNVPSVLSGCPHLDPLLMWNATSTWANGQVPIEGENVIVTNDVLLLESPPILKSITIESGARLVIYPGDIKIVTDFIHIKGRLDAGSEDCRFTGQLNITLTGEPNNNVVENFGEKFIGVDSGGTLELHGEDKISWTKLKDTTKKTNVIYNHVPGSFPTTSMSIKGVVACVVNMTVPKVTFCKAYTTGGGHLFYAKKGINELKELIDGQEEGSVIMIAAQKVIVGVHSTPELMGGLFTSLEQFGWGQSLNQSAMRRVTGASSYVFIGRKGDPSFAEESIGKGYATITKLHKESGLKFKVSSIVDVATPSKCKTELFVGQTFPQISLSEEVPSWKLGDRIVLASTDFSWQQAELRTIASVSGTKIDLDDGMDYMHFGKVIDGVDERGEVAMLSRNIVIQGGVDNQCPDENNCEDMDLFGGHLQVIRNFKNVHIEGVEFKHMGKQNPGHSAINFYMCHDIDDENYASTQYIRNSSIHHSPSRCITVQGTHGLSIEDNVCWDTYGHGYVLADGGEKRTVFDGNFGGGQRKATSASMTVDKNTDPATFFLTNPMSYVRNNVAGGGDGNGFGILFPKAPVGDSLNEGFMEEDEADATAFYEFNNNVVHSNKLTGLFVDRRLQPDGSVLAVFNSYFPIDPITKLPQHVTIHRLTAYKNIRQNVWTRNGPFRFTKASNIDGKTVQESIVIGETENIGEPSTWTDNGNVITYHRGLPDARSRPLQGVLMYQGPNNFTRVWMDGFKNSEYFKAGAISFRTSNFYGVSPLGSTSEMLFGFDDGESTGNRVYDDFGNNGFETDDGILSDIFRDVDGSVTSFPKKSLVKPDAFFDTNGCAIRSNWNMRVCDAKYGTVAVKITSLKKVASFMIREDATSARLDMSPEQYAKNYVVRLGGDTKYTLHFKEEVPSMFELLGYGVEQGLSVRIGVCIGPNVGFKMSLGGSKILRWDLIGVATSLQDLDDDDINTKYFYDSDTGMLYVKLMSTVPRSGDDVGNCPGGTEKCPKLKITITDETTFTGDCLDSLGLNRRYIPVADAMGAVPLPASALTPPEDWGARETKPFISRLAINGEFGEWSGWTDCTVTCGGAEVTRNRACDSPAPENGGDPCEGPVEEVRVCAPTLCPINGDLTTWSAWSVCEAISDNGCEGFRQRHRTCTPPQNGGIYCQGSISEVMPSYVSTLRQRTVAAGFTPKSDVHSSGDAKNVDL
ncbi:hypothetical protein ScPMuIL_010863 [Solemya velum]